MADTLWYQSERTCSVERNRGVPRELSILREAVGGYCGILGYWWLFVAPGSDDSGARRQFEDFESELRYWLKLKLINSQNLFAEHPQAGSLLFEHRDVQFVPPNRQGDQKLVNFDFEFLRNSKNKMNCNVWRMKTRVVVNASEWFWISKYFRVQCLRHPKCSLKPCS